MEGGESPLDVLSRAATMLQENQQAAEESAKQSPSSSSSLATNNNKQLPTAKWKRDRRQQRLPEYTRKSDPKIPENWEPQQPPPSPEDIIINNNGQDSNNIPLDMSIRQQNRGQPPSYTQTINNPTFRSNYRSATGQNNREDLPPGISMCDPIIDEHFRRSLGNDYLTLYSNNNVSAKETLQKPCPMKEQSTSPPIDGTTANVIELMDSSGLSVDDHFAKALGDTWAKLNKKEPSDLKNSENNLVSI